MDDSSDLQLDLALRLDELAETFKARLEAEPDLTPEAFAAEHGDVPSSVLVPVLRGLGMLGRSSKQHLGPFQEGDQVGPYEIKGTIGRGGMGIVYDAVETGLGRRVALKALHGIDTDERTRARFEREARAAAGLDHPAIVPVLGSGETRGVLWYAMRRVDGQALDQVMSSLAKDQPEPVRRAALSQLEGSASSASRSGSSVAAARLPLRARAAVVIVHRLAEAMAYAHARGILHRDVKPANVLLDRDGEPSLTDFGLCKIEGDQSLTREGDIVGTLRYMPPEALEGRFDHRGDVYGLGLVLYELAAGRSAFSGDSKRSVLQEVLHVTPPALRKVAPEMPEDLERILRKALAKLPEERYESAEEFAEDLDALLSGKPVRARRPSPFYLLGLFVRRNRALAATLVAATLSLVAGTAYYVVSLQGAYGEVSDALALAERSGAEARLSAAEASLRTADVAAASVLLAEVPAEHRGWLWNHLSARIGAPEDRLSVGIRDVEGMTVSADGELLATFGWDGIELRDRRGLAEVTPLDIGVIDAAFVDEGNAMLVLERSPRQVSVIDLPSGDVTLTHPINRRTARLRVLPGTDIAVLLEGYNTLVGLDWRTGEELWRQRIPVPRIQVFDPLNESEIVFGTTGGQVLRASVSGGSAKNLPGHLGRATALLVEGGDVLASGGSDGSLELHPALTGHGFVRVRLDGEITCLARSTEEPHMIAVGLSTRTVALVDARLGVPVTVAAGLETRPRGVDLGRDPWLVTLGTGNVLSPWERDDHDGRMELSPAIGNLYDVGASDDGRWIVAMASDNMVWIQDLAEGTTRAFPTPLTGSDDRPSFAPDGNTVAVGPEVRDLSTGDVILRTSEKSAHHSDYLPSGWLCGVRSEERGLLCWRWNGGDEAENLGVVEVPHEGPLVRLVASNTEEVLFGASYDGLLFRLDGRAMGLAWSRMDDHEIRDVTLDEATGAVLAACADGVVRAYDPATGDELRDRAWRASPSYSRKSTLSSIVPGPEPGLVTTCTMDGRVVLWEATTGRRVGSLLEVGSEVRHLDMVGSTGWIVAGGGFGRTVLLGSGAPPVAPRAVAQGGLDPAAAVDLCLQADGSVSAMTRSIRNSRRLRSSPWRTQALERLSAAAK